MKSKRNHYASANGHRWLQPALLVPAIGQELAAQNRISSAADPFESAAVPGVCNAFVTSFRRAHAGFVSDLSRREPSRVCCCVRIVRRVHSSGRKNVAQSYYFGRFNFKRRRCTASPSKPMMRSDSLLQRSVHSRHPGAGCTRNLVAACRVHSRDVLYYGYCALASQARLLDSAFPPFARGRTCFGEKGLGESAGCDKQYRTVLARAVTWLRSSAPGC